MVGDDNDILSWLLRQDSDLGADWGDATQLSESQEQLEHTENRFDSQEDGYQTFQGGYQEVQGLAEENGAGELPKLKRQRQGPSSSSGEGLRELKKKIRAAEERISFYKDILEEDQSGSAAASNGDMAVILGKIEACVCQERPKETKARKLVSKVWNDCETFGTSYQNVISSRFFRLARNLVSFNGTGAYCKILASKDPSIQEGLMQSVGLSAEQINTIQRMVADLPDFGTAFGSVCSRSLQGRENFDSALSKFQEFINCLKRALRPSQVGKFCHWVHNDESCKIILDGLWASTMDSLNLGQSRVAPTSKSSARPPKPGNRLNTYDVSEGQGMLREARYDSLCGIRSLLEKSDVGMRVHQHFSEDVLLIDLLSGAQSTGRQALEEYLNSLPTWQSISERFIRLESMESSSGSCAWEVMDDLGVCTELVINIVFKDNSFTIVQVSFSWVAIHPQHQQSQLSGYSDQQPPQEQFQAQHGILPQHLHDEIPTSVQHSQHPSGWYGKSPMCYGERDHELKLQQHIPLHQADLMSGGCPLSTPADNVYSDMLIQPFSSESLEDLSSLRKAAAHRIREAFETRDRGLLRRLLLETISSNAIFVDSALGGEFQSLERIELYIYRLRCAFPEMAWADFHIEQVADQEMRCTFLVRGLYAGRLAQGAQPCCFSGSARIVFEPNSPHVQHVYLLFDAHGLTRQFH